MTARVARPLSLATAAAAVAIGVGVVAIPIVSAMPSPLMLCTFRPPFDCLAARLTGSQYLSGDGAVALVWLLVSLVMTSGASLAAVWLVERGRSQQGRILAGIALIPNLLHFAGQYALLPFHAAVFALTLFTFVVLLRARPHVSEQKERIEGRVS